MALCGARLFVDPLPPGEVFGGGLFCGLPGADETHLVAGQVEGRGEVGGGEGRGGASLSNGPAIGPSSSLFVEVSVRQRQPPSS